MPAQSGPVCGVVSLLAAYICCLSFDRRVKNSLAVFAAFAVLDQLRPAVWCTVEQQCVQQCVQQSVQSQSSSRRSAHCDTVSDISSITSSKVQYVSVHAFKCRQSCFYTSFRLSAPLQEGFNVTLTTIIKKPSWHKYQILTTQYISSINILIFHNNP